MFSDGDFQTSARRDFEPVLHHYDGLKGAVIQWTLANGNTNHDPSVLAWVIDPKGKVIAKCPSATGIKSWMSQHAKGSFPLVDPNDYPEVRKEAAVVASRRNLGKVMGKLRKMASQADEQGFQAKKLLAKVEAYAMWKASRARELQTTDPAAALALYREISIQFKGDSVGELAGKTYQQLKGDKAFQAELKATQLLDRAEALVKELEPAKYKGELVYGDPEFVKKNARELRQIGAYLGAIVKRYPETRAASKAQALIAQLKLE